MFTLITEKGSPFAYKQSETRSSYLERLDEIARGIIEIGMRTEFEIYKLAFIAQELPYNYDWDQDEKLFPEIRNFLGNLDNRTKSFFKESYIAHGGHISHIHFFIPTERDVSPTKINKGVFPLETLNPNIPVTLFK
jgi:hypothetical protein